MTEAVEKLLPQLLALPAEDRAEVVHILWQSLPNIVEDLFGDFDPEFVAELERRVEEMRSGRDPGRPVDEVMRELREKYG